MRVLLVIAAAVHVVLLVALFLVIGADGSLRTCAALVGAALVSGLWLLWLHGQHRDAELARPPAPLAATSRSESLTSQL